MKNFKELALDIVTRVEEDAPANAAGSGNVAGIGVGPDLSLIHIWRCRRRG